MDWKESAKRLCALAEMRNMTKNDVADEAGLPRSTVGRWLRGEIPPPADKLDMIVQALHTTFSFVLGEDMAPVKIPLLGKITCGPNGVIRTEWDEFVTVRISDPDSHFFLRAKGKSMEPRIHAGDLVLIHQQDDVVSGEIAAVLYNLDEYEPSSTLKRVIRREGYTLLQPINPGFEPMVFYREQQNQLRVVGKAVRVYADL